MLGKEEEFNSIPYFWSVQYGKSLRYCGHALSWDEIVYNGSPKDRKFVAYYIKYVQFVCVGWLRDLKNSAYRPNTSLSDYSTSAKKARGT